MNLTASQLKVLTRVGVSACLEAAELYRLGNGCSTVGFILNLHWKTASTAMDVGVLLPIVRYSPLSTLNS